MSSDGKYSSRGNADSLVVTEFGGHCCTEREYGIAIPSGTIGHSMLLLRMLPLLSRQKSDNIWCRWCWGKVGSRARCGRKRVSSTEHVREGV